MSGRDEARTIFIPRTNKLIGDVIRDDTRYIIFGSYIGNKRIHAGRQFLIALWLGCFSLTFFFFLFLSVSWPSNYKRNFLSKYWRSTREYVFHFILFHFICFLFYFIYFFLFFLYRYTCQVSLSVIRGVA